MIHLTKELCQELDLTYWQTTTLEETKIESNRINREEKELLRKIMLAKGVTLTEEMVEIKADGIVVIKLKHHQLIFAGVKVTDTEKTTHLSKISEMLKVPEEKKLTWYKLKNLDLL